MTTQPTEIQIVGLKNGQPTIFDWYQERYYVASIEKFLEPKRLDSFPQFRTVQFYHVRIQGGPIFTMFESENRWYVYAMTP